MKNWLRGAQVSKPLIIILVLAVIVFCIYWGIKCRGSDNGGVVDPDRQFKLYCPGREEPYIYTRAETVKLKKDPVTKKIENPETGECDCTFGRRPDLDTGGAVLP